MWAFQQILLNNIISEGKSETGHPPELWKLPAISVKISYGNNSESHRMQAPVNPKDITWIALLTTRYFQENSQKSNIKTLLPESYTSNRHRSFWLGVWFLSSTQHGPQLNLQNKWCLFIAWFPCQHVIFWGDLFVVHLLPPSFAQWRPPWNQ